MILVVDDNESNRELASQVLSEFWPVRLAADGLAGLEAVAAERPAFVLLDLSMPRLDGWGMLERLKQAVGTREIPVVACSAHAMRGDRERALAAGFDGYVAKPYRPGELIACIEGFLGKAEARRVEDDGWGGDDWSLEEGDWDG